MLPSFAGFKQTDLLPPLLPEPIQAEFTFLGGPFDGHKSTATIHRELSDRVKVIMKKGGHKRVKKYVYVYAGDHTFQYEGIYKG